VNDRLGWMGIARENFNGRAGVRQTIGDNL
jgi:hypothetical protein